MAKEVDAKFPGAEKHEISLDEAKKHIQRHKKNPIHPKHHGGSFDRAAIDKILAQTGCKALRIYHGKNEDGTPSLVLVGIDAAGKDMTKAVIMEGIQPCPPFCDKSSELLA
ncbi:MAG: hypothetical protein NTX44_05765 [Ignavibacteriales bacterium]|nr:hypothetical protein [Ignavibacteriales bacterium]